MSATKALLGKFIALAAVATTLSTGSAVATPLNVQAAMVPRSKSSWTSKTARATVCGWCAAKAMPQEPACSTVRAIFLPGKDGKPQLNDNESQEITMFYVKNVPNWERILRIVMGLMALGFAAMRWGSPLAMGAGIMGAVLSMTGLFGFCPMCAMVGRKLDKGA